MVALIDFKSKYATILIKASLDDLHFQDEIKIGNLQEQNGYAHTLIKVMKEWK